MRISEEDHGTQFTRVTHEWKGNIVEDNSRQSVGLTFLWGEKSNGRFMCGLIVQGIPTNDLEVAGNNLNFCTKLPHTIPYTKSKSSQEFSVRIFFNENLKTKFLNFRKKIKKKICQVIHQILNVFGVAEYKNAIKIFQVDSKQINLAYQVKIKNISCT